LIFIYQEVLDMRFFIGAMMIFVVLLVSGVTANEVSDQGISSDTWWNGSWMSDYFTLLILQNGSSIAGSYEPFDITVYDPGLLKGSLSEDNTVFSGVWTETGKISLILADDEMSFSGTGTVIQTDGQKPFTYTKTGTRIGEDYQKEIPWNGSWKTESNTYSLMQNGSVVSGTYIPLSLDADEPGFIEGTVTEDGKELKGTWVESGNFSFKISDNKQFFNGTYGIEHPEQAITDFWNGTKIQ
jgi:hypothetical protein